MKRREFCHQFVGAGILVGVSASFSHAAPKVAPKVASKSKIKWQKDLRAAQKMAIEQDKPLMIVFGANWCTYCHKLERETFGDKRIATVIEREFIPVHLDYDKETKVVKMLEVEKLPCTVFLTPQADFLHKSEGFANVKEFQKTMTSVLDKRTEIQQAGSTTMNR